MIFVQNKAIGVKIIIKRLCVACCNLNIMCFGSVGFFELFLNYLLRFLYIIFASGFFDNYKT